MKLVKQSASYGHEIDYMLVSYASGVKVRHMVRLDKQTPREVVAAEIRRIRREVRECERNIRARR